MIEDEPEDDLLEVEWVPHCDMPNCDLGTVDYHCPACHRDCTSFDAWWKRTEVVENEGEATIECDQCGADLTLYWDSQERETRIRIANQGG